MIGGRLRCASPGDDWRVTPPDDVSAFGHESAAVLRLTLADGLVGAYFVGSIALGGYVRGESDIDIVAVCDEEVDEATRQAVIEKVLELTPNCPTRGLEFTLYRARVASSPRAETGFELNVNGGPRMPRSVHLSPHDEPRFWYVLDRAIAHRHGVPICGPPVREVFADIQRHVLLEVIGESMRWQREHEKASLYSVLNASRAWRFAVEDVLGSKLEGAQWARPRWQTPSLIDAAVDLRHGRPAQLDAEEVDRFIDHVERVLVRAE
jgi:predicted nucleotidyltransferase